MRISRPDPESTTRASAEATATGANPTDRAKTGTKRHLLTEGKGIPIGIVISGANRTDMKKLADKILELK